MSRNPRTPNRRHARARLLVPVLHVILLASTVAAQIPPAEPGEQGGGKLKVMTYNVYVGTEYAGMTSANIDTFLQAATNVAMDIRANDPPGRAQAVARQIATHSPHLVSLQEVFTLSTGPTKDNLTLEYDYLQLLLQALAEQGAHYTPVVTFETWGATFPSTMGYVRNSWRIVILARSDLKPEHLYFTNVQAATFSLDSATTMSYRLPALEGAYGEFCPVPLTDTRCNMPWPRGWASVDVTYRGKQFRYINATLESRSNSRNIAQGLQLLNGPINSALPVILAGDLNCDLSNLSDPRRITCTRFLDAGFFDAWTAANPSEIGFSKLLEPLRPPPLPTLIMRGEYVMVRSLFSAQAAALLGQAYPADLTASGLWPSNHCAVIVKLERPGPE